MKCKKRISNLQEWPALSMLFFFCLSKFDEFWIYLKSIKIQMKYYWNVRLKYLGKIPKLNLVKRKRKEMFNAKSQKWTRREMWQTQLYQLCVNVVKVKWLLNWTVDCVHSCEYGIFFIFFFISYIYKIYCLSWSLLNYQCCCCLLLLLSVLFLFLFCMCVCVCQ